MEMFDISFFDQKLIFLEKIHIIIFLYYNNLNYRIEIQ